MPLEKMMPLEKTASYGADLLKKQIIALSGRVFSYLPTKRPHLLHAFGVGTLVRSKRLRGNKDK